MGLIIMNVNIIKNMKMPSNRRHLCLFILLFSVVFSLCNADDQSDLESNGGAERFGPPVIQFDTKYNNRDISEISVKKPRHHLRHQSSHNSGYRSRSNGVHHKQHNHQSSDTAYNGIPGYPHQAHSPKKNTHHIDDDAFERIGRGGFHLKNHPQQQQQHQQNKSHRQLTTIGPNKSRSYSRSNSYGSAEKMNKRNWSDNLTRSRQAPYQNTYSSMNGARAYNPYARTYHSPRHTTTTTTTTSTTTSTVAPDTQEKDSYDAPDKFNIIDSDDIDDDDIYSGTDYEEEDTKKRSPQLGLFDADYKTSQQSSENYQRDDPVRSFNSYNRNTTSAFKSQSASSDGDNYQLNMNNDGSTRSNSPTIETSKSVDVKITNLMTQNNQTRPWTLTEEKSRTLGTYEAVNKTFNAYNEELERNIHAHIRRVAHLGQCRPKMQVIPLPHDPTKKYSPHCTVLYRCSNHLGCCHTDSKSCLPSKIETVTLPFFVTKNGKRTIDLKPFDNHTECHCVSRQNVSPTPSPAPLVPHASQLQNDDPLTRVSSAETDWFRFITTTTTTERPNRCNCPKYFINISGYQCKCDCPAKQLYQAINMCDKLKYGLEHFSIKERRCISSESCEYGEYDIRAGHCPRQDEAFSSNALNSD